MPLADQTFESLLEQLRRDADVLGAFLSGSRGKGFATAHSDYDVVIIVQNGSLTSCQTRYPFKYAVGVDCIVYDLAGFEAYAVYGSAEAWSRYDFAHVELLFDRTGNLSRLIEEKGHIPGERLNEVLRGSLDAYLNGLYRSLKCLRNENLLGAKLEASIAVHALLTFLFALERRHAPFAEYLELELTHYPLSTLPMLLSDLLTLIDRILVSGDSVAQQTLLQMVDGLAQKAGLSDVLTDWGNDYSWMQTFVPLKKTL